MRTALIFARPKQSKASNRCTKTLAQNTLSSDCNGIIFSCFLRWTHADLARPQFRLARGLFFTFPLAEGVHMRSSSVPRCGLRKQKSSFLYTSCILLFAASDCTSRVSRSHHLEHQRSHHLDHQLT